VVVEDDVRPEPQHTRAGAADAAVRSRHRAGTDGVQAAAASTLRGAAAGRSGTTGATGGAGRRVRRTAQVVTAQTRPKPADSQTVG
jgi:hypothetical protein